MQCDQPACSRHCHNIWQIWQSKAWPSCVRFPFTARAISLSYKHRCYKMHFCCMFAYLTPDIRIDMHFGWHTHTAPFSLPLPPSLSPSLLALGLQIIFWHSIRHLFSGVRSRHRMLHAKFSCCCCCCCSKQTEKVATMFQIIYFGIADYVAYLWDFSLCVCVRTSLAEL